MNLIEQFERLDKLIIDRSTETAKMRGILNLIREHLEAYQQDSETRANLVKKHNKAILRLKSENSQQAKKLETKISELQQHNTQLKQSLEKFYSGERANRRRVLI